MLEHTNPAEEGRSGEAFDPPKFLSGLTGQPQPLGEPEPDTCAGEAQGLTVKYDGEVMTLSPEQAVSFAQKGMNYDRILTQRDAAASRAALLEEEIGLLRSGEQPEDPDQEEQRRMQRGWLAFIERYPDIRDPKNELPAEVWQEIRAGKPPAAAYLEFQNRQLEARVAALQISLAALEQSRRAKEKSPGSAVAPTPSQGALDPFVEGLLQGF